MVEQRWEGAIRAGGDGVELLVIRDDDAYTRLIDRLPRARVQMKQPAPPSDDPLLARPAIDFARRMLIAVVRGGTLAAPVIARVDGATVWYHAPPPPQAAHPHGIGVYAAVVVPRVDGPIELRAPRVIADERELAGAVGTLVTLRGELSRTRIPTLLGVDVEAGRAEGGAPAEATGWLEQSTVTQTEIDERIAASGQFAHRGAGAFRRLVALDGRGLAAAAPW